MKQAPLHASISEDFLEMLADMKYYDNEGNVVNLRKKCGQPDTDLLLYILGFHWNNKRNRANYEMLTEDVKYHRRYDSKGVYVRNNSGTTRIETGYDVWERPIDVEVVGKSYEVRQMKVYTGYIRKNYPYKDLYKDGEIKVGNFTHGGELKNILEIGKKTIYKKSKYEGGSFRLLKEEQENNEE